MATYEEIKQEIFAHEAPTVPDHEVEVVELAEAVSEPQSELSPQLSRSKKSTTMAHIIMAVSMSAIVCAGTLLYLNGSSPSKKEPPQRNDSSSQTLVEWVLGRKIDKNRIRSGYGSYGFDQHEQNINIRRQLDPSYGFAETN
jgi:hypothetical protein